MKRLITTNLYASYYKKEILNGISIEINSQEIVAIVGPNGAGKSTLLKVIAGILKPTTGFIFFNEKRIDSLPQFNIARLGIAYLSQTGDVFKEFSVRDNLLLGALFFDKKTRQDRYDEMMTLFPSLSDISKKKVGLLSGGQQRLVSIATILMNDNKNLTLLLDEPSAGLNPNLMDLVFNSILTIRNSKKATIIIVEQNIDRALNISDKFFLIRNGKICYTESKGSFNKQKIFDHFIGRI